METNQLLNNLTNYKKTVGLREQKVSLNDMKFWKTEKPNF